MELKHEEAKPLIAAYVLGAVPADELASLRRHIMSCDECIAESESLMRSADSILLTVDPAELPWGFAGRVMAQVASERAADATRSKHGRPRWSLLPIATVTAALLLTAIFWRELMITRQELARNRDVINALLREDGLGMAVHGSVGSVAKVVPISGGSLFIAAGLDDPPDAHTYQLWLMKGNCEPDEVGPCDVLSAGTFDVSDGLAILRTSMALHGVGRVAVTIEPAGGSSEPTSDPIMDTAL